MAPGRLDLGDDGRGPPPRLGDLADQAHVVGVPHEGERDVIDAEPEAEVEVVLVLLGQRGDAHAPRRQVGADSVAKRARLRDRGAHVEPLDGGDREDDAAVVEEDDVARAQILRRDPRRRWGSRPGPPAGCPSGPRRGTRSLSAGELAVPPGKRPQRILGPQRSWRMATGLSHASAAARTVAKRRACSSWEPCEKLSRATSMPARMSCSSVA